MGQYKPLRFDVGTGGFKPYQSDDTWLLDYTFGSITSEVNHTRIVSASPVGAGLGAGGYAVQQKFEYTPDALDSATSIIIGSWYDMTAAPPVPTASAAIFIGDSPTLTSSNWDQGIICYSSNNLFEYTGVVTSDIILQVKSNPSNNLGNTDVLKGLQIGITANAGDHADSRIYGSVSQLNAASGGVATAFYVKDALWDRAFVSDGGVWEIDINNGVNGIIIGQSGAGGNILELKDGTVAGGTQRFAVYGTGHTVIATTADLAAEVLRITQSDVDEKFIFFDGTASNPAAGSPPANSLTEINGSGAVVGPQAPSGSPDTGWDFYGMILHKVNAVGGGTVDVWLPGFLVSTT